MVCRTFKRAVAKWASLPYNAEFMPMFLDVLTFLCNRSQPNIAIISQSNITYLLICFCELKLVFNSDCLGKGATEFVCKLSCRRIERHTCMLQQLGNLIEGK